MKFIKERRSRHTTREVYQRAAEPPHDYKGCKERQAAISRNGKPLKSVRSHEEGRHCAESGEPQSVSDTSAGQELQTLDGFSLVKQPISQNVVSTESGEPQQRGKRQNYFALASKKTTTPSGIKVNLTKLTTEPQVTEVTSCMFPKLITSKIRPPDLCKNFDKLNLNSKYTCLS